MPLIRFFGACTREDKRTINGPGPLYPRLYPVCALSCYPGSLLTDAGRYPAFL